MNCRNEYLAKVQGSQNVNPVRFNQRQGCNNRFDCIEAFFGTASLISSDGLTRKVNMKVPEPQYELTSEKKPAEHRMQDCIQDYFPGLILKNVIDARKEGQGENINKYEIEFNIHFKTGIHESQ